MLLELTADQEFFRETTAKFLADQMPIDRLRWLGENRSAPEAAAAEADFWRRGADLGWAALLVSEEAGGGSISGQGVIDLSLIAHEFGRHAAPGPLRAGQPGRGRAERRRGAPWRAGGTARRHGDRRMVPR